jgi:hypothetical protein
MAAAMNDAKVNAANVVETPAPAPDNDAPTHIANNKNSHIRANFVVSSSGELPVLKKVAKKLKKTKPYTKDIGIASKYEKMFRRKGCIRDVWKNK